MIFPILVLGAAGVIIVMGDFGPVYDVFGGILMIIAWAYPLRYMEKK